METLWWLGTKKDLSFESNRTAPEIQAPDDVKIEVAFSGVCGSDFHFMKGEMGKFSPKSDGVILGHEFSGTVVGVGNKANFAVGDKVCVNPNICCGECDWADDNLPHFCESNITVGVKRDGGWAKYCVVPERVVHKLPSCVSLEQGALAEPYSCVLRGWNMLSPFPPVKSRVLVQGAGIIGSMFCTLLHHKGYSNVTVTEPSDDRRRMCSEMGLGFDVVAPQELELKMAGQDVDKQGFHLIIDCTGNPKANQKCIEFARRGAKISWFGCCPAGKTVAIEPFQIYWKELTIVGSFINPFCFAETLDLLEELAKAGYLNYDKLGVKRFQLKEHSEAFDCLRSGKASKAMFQFAD